MSDILPALTLLSTAALFGGMLLFAGGFAAFAFTALPQAAARSLIRRAFPPFYAFVIGAAGLAALTAAAHDRLSSLMLAAIALSTVPNRQLLMPMINRASDAGRQQRFKRLHGLSVAITLLHLVLAAAVLLRLA